jgi:hypothetical protein
MKAVIKLLKLTAIAIAVLIGLFLLSLTCVPRPGMENTSIIRTRLEIGDLNFSLNHYKSVYGGYPTGEYSNIVSVLAGDNPQKVVFLNFRRTSEHPNVMVDPWGMPYQIIFLQQTNFIIRSAGKDKIFGNADDIVFNSASNDFVKP